MSPIVKIDNDGGFEEFRKSNESNKEKLIVMDFFATWCKPCTNIEPHIVRLSSQYPSTEFIKIDIDKCETAVSEFKIKSLPTFVFMRGGKVLHSLTSTDHKLLESKLKELAGEPTAKASDASISSASIPATPGFMDLAPLLLKSNCECLNCDSEHNLDSALTKGMEYLKSDTDEQLIIYLRFQQVVKLHSLRISAPEDSGPKTLKLFTNQITTPDFDACEGGEGVQTIICTPENLKSNELLILKYVKFQNVTNLTIFVKDNQTGAENTVITNLSLYGNPVNTTNMSDFKRVTGKKGESHG